MNTEKLTRPEELMLYTQISVAANKMNQYGIERTQRQPMQNHA